jgi:hypothetical protein
MAFALLSRSRSKPQGTARLAPKRKSTGGAYSGESRFEFVKPVSKLDNADPPHAVAIQTKLRVQRPNDEFEQEADRVSEQVMRTPERMGQPKPT